MARAKQNGFFDALTEKKVTYRRSVKRAPKSAADKEMRDWQIQTQKDFAYETGARHKREGKRPVPVRIVTTEAAKKILGAQKAASVAKIAYMQGYRSNPAKKRNPEQSAAALSEAWHGRKSKTSTEYDEVIHVHEYLTDLGRLMELEVSPDGRYAKTIKFDKETRLASSENGKQLYVVGGDQTLDLGAFGIKGDEAEKDLVVVGEVLSVTYVTAKHHLGKADKTPGPYRHALGEDGGEVPTLLYDTMNGTIGFAGGSYKIVPDDYDGKHSAGLRN